MKLIAYGKVMEDDNKSLKDYSIKEGDFLVVMISKVSKDIEVASLLIELRIYCLCRPNQQLNQRKIRKWRNQ
jgi:hypothetical protein